MMFGSNWSGRSGCILGFGNGYFSFWHLLIMAGIVIIIFSILAIRKSKMPMQNDAVEKLKMLYVNGEISEEDYLKRKNTIEGK